MLVEKYSTVYFVDRMTYNGLLSAHFTIDDIPTLINKNHPKVSTLTRGSLIYINNILSMLFYQDSATKDRDIVLYNAEKQYIKDNFKETYIETHREVLLDDKKYYEIVTLPDYSVLVVTENGFLSFVTESKENLLKFFLDCLRAQFKSGAVSCQIKSYIDAKLNSVWFNIIKQRVFSAIES